MMIAILDSVDLVATLSARLKLPRGFIRLRCERVAKTLGIEWKAKMPASELAQIEREMVKTYQR